MTAVERLIAGDLGPNIANLGDPNYTYDAARGYFVLGGDVGLNFRHDAGDGGDNGNFVGPDYPDRPIPGLPGTTLTADQAAAEAIVFLEFKAAGLFEMGVGSDDCFKVTTWHNPRDRFALTLGQFNGTRGMTETRVILLNIPEPGIYPFRCLWANATGATGWEWYLFDKDGNRNLINDATNSVAVAYREGPLRPYVASVFPNIGAANVSPATDVIVEFVDETVAVDGDSIQLTVNDGATTGTQTVTKSGNKTTARFTPASPLALGSTNTVRLVYSDLGNPSLTVTNSWSFVTTTALISPIAAVPANQVDQTALGFRLFVHQLDGVEFDNGAALGNIRDQLEGILGANLADLSGADANGFFYLTNPLAGGTNVVNLNNFYQIPEKGNFTANNGFPDLKWPGTPGAGGLDWNADNLATEILTFVELPAAGGYTMGIKSWDSFSVTVGDAEGRSPKDLFATVLGQYDGDAPGNYLFSFFVPEAGIYPIRLIHNIGVQQGDLEWFTVDATGTVLTLLSAPGGLKSYPRGPALPAYVRRVSPGPNIAGIQNFMVTDVLPGTPVFAEIRDDGTTVSPGDARLTLNGGGQSTATKANGITTVTLTNVPELEPGSENTVTLVYTDSAGKTFTNTWTFMMADAFQLDPALSYPLGSGDATKRGFAVRTVQLATPFVSGENGSGSLGEALLAGVFLGGANVANLEDDRYPKADGWWHLQTLNIGNDTDAGTRNLITPDDPVPGIPGTTGSADHFATEVRTYLELPKAGLYNLSLYSDDTPRMFQAEAQDHHFGALEIVEPCSLAGTRLAMCATWAGGPGGDFGAPLPLEDLVLNLVAADPLLGNEPLANAAAAKDSAVLLKRGAVAFGIKAANAKAAGARAVIIFNDESGDRPDRPPIYMGGTATGVDIPCIFIGHRDGTNLIALLAQGPVKVNLRENSRPAVLGSEWEGFVGRWDVTLYAPQPGVYPLRIVSKQGSGGYGLELAQRKQDDTWVLVNDPNDAEALKAYRSVTTRPVMLTPTTGESCNRVNIFWRGSGRLLEAGAVNGPYTPSANQSMPHVEPASSQKFFRVEQMK